MRALELRSTLIYYQSNLRSVALKSITTEMVAQAALNRAIIEQSIDLASQIGLEGQEENVEIRARRITEAAEIESALRARAARLPSLQAGEAPSVLGQELWSRADKLRKDMEETSKANRIKMIYVRLKGRGIIGEEEVIEGRVVITDAKKIETYPELKEVIGYQARKAAKANPGVEVKLVQPGNKSEAETAWKTDRLFRNIPSNISKAELVGMGYSFEEKQADYRKPSRWTTFWEEQKESIRRLAELTKLNRLLEGIGRWGRNGRIEDSEKIPENNLVNRRVVLIRF